MNPSVKTASNSPLRVEIPPSGGPKSALTNGARASLPPLPPGPRGNAIFGSLFDLISDPLASFVEATYEYGDVVRLRFPGIEYVLINDPESIRRVLVDRHELYPKSRQYDQLRPFLGNGLVTSEGAFWRRQRKLAQPAFHPKKVAAFAPDMSRATDAMLERWEAHERSGGYFDVAEEMQRVTLRIAGETLFSIDLDDESQAVGTAMAIGQRYANDVLNAFLPIPKWLPTKKNRDFRSALRTLDSVVYRILDERRRKGSPEREDLLAMRTLR